MIAAALLLLAATDPYGPLVDKHTGEACPMPPKGEDIYDITLLTTHEILNISPGAIERCTKVRQRLLDQQKARKRKPK